MAIRSPLLLSVSLFYLVLLLMIKLWSCLRLPAHLQLWFCFSWVWVLLLFQLLSLLLLLLMLLTFWMHSDQCTVTVGVFLCFVDVCFLLVLLLLISLTFLHALRPVYSYCWCFLCFVDVCFLLVLLLLISLTFLHALWPVNSYCWCFWGFVDVCFLLVLLLLNVDVANFLACARAGLQLFSASSIPNFPLFAPIILSTQTDGLYIGSTTIMFVLRMRSMIFTSGIYLKFDVRHLWNFHQPGGLEK